MSHARLPRSATYDDPPSPRMEPLLLRLREVVALVSAHRSTVIRWVALGEFPAPVRLPGRRVAWRLAEVIAWTEARERAR
jgi:predicted DNA-binding transcriptional regulator AlpA